MQPTTETIIPSETHLNTDFSIVLKDTVSNKDKNVNFYTILFTWKQTKVWKTSPKRFSEFESFHNLLKHINKETSTIAFPPKLLVHSKESLEERKNGLTNYIYTVTKNPNLIQLPEVAQFFDIPFVVQLFYSNTPLELPNVSIDQIPSHLQKMYDDGKVWASHFKRLYLSLHQLHSFEEQQDFFKKNDKMFKDMKSFFEVQMNSFGQAMKEVSEPSLKEIFSTSHRIWLWIVNMPQIVHALHVLPPPTFINVVQYLNKTTGQINIPTSVTKSTGDCVKDFQNQTKSLINRITLCEVEVMKIGYVLNEEIQTKILKLSTDIKYLVDSVISYNQFTNGDNCNDLRDIYSKVTDLDIAFIGKGPTNDCQQKVGWIEAKSNSEQYYVMQELYQPFVL
ncbi:PX domain-containing protein [Entamoeba marina]